MAFNLSADDADEEAGLHDINVTPFIDVMLVLLIVFMVAAPLATVNVPLDLPVSSARAAPDASPRCCQSNANCSPHDAVRSLNATA